MFGGSQPGFDSAGHRDWEVLCAVAELLSLSFWKRLLSAKDRGLDMSREEETTGVTDR